MRELWNGLSLALRSLLPEWWLIRTRDGEALTEKYFIRAPEAPRHYRWQGVAQSGGHMSVMGVGVKGSSFQAETLDGEGLGGDSGFARIHLGRVHQPGLDVLGAGLGGVASEIVSNPEMSRMHYIVGLTYEELARLAVRGGFHVGRLVDPEPVLLKYLESAHAAFCAVNRRRHRQFKPTVVYMPLADFLGRYLPTQAGE